ncbi:hypothetical protein [Streptacidiphilus carbonis]|uniref:hypothetical protein n=1 Tax=Streptacidiphilus carbonis TaxID=105422 RepID=UPI0005A6301B|nr:hypothetical protein [Streptacidiphilus carbonis]
MALLVWRLGEHFDHFNDLPCFLCRRPTPLRSHTDEPAHKVCAEQWQRLNPHSRRFRSDATEKKSRHLHAVPDSDPTASRPWDGETLFDLA